MKKITKNRGITLLGALLCVSSLSFGGTSSGSKKITGDFKGPCPTITITITSQTNALCNGLNDGSVTVSASGGAVPYTYSWNTKPVQTGDTASSLAAGNYKVYVTDSNGCKDSSVITITQPPALVLSATAYSATCYGACNGAIDFSVTGGTGSDTYELNGSSWSGEPPIGGLCAGSQLLSVTDSNGCTADTTIMIAQPTAVIATAKASPDDICAGSSSVI